VCTTHRMSQVLCILSLLGQCRSHMGMPTTHACTCLRQTHVHDLQHTLSVEAHKHTGRSVCSAGSLYLLKYMRHTCSDTLTCTYMHIHRRTNTHIHANTQSPFAQERGALAKHAHMHIHTRTYTQAHTFTQAQAHIHTHTCTHTHTHPLQDVTKFGLPKDMVGALDYVAPEVFKVTSPEAQKQIKAGSQSGTYDYKVDVWMVGGVRVCCVCVTTKWICGWWVCGVCAVCICV